MPISALSAFSKKALKNLIGSKRKVFIILNITKVLIELIPLKINMLIEKIKFSNLYLSNGGQNYLKNRNTIFCSHIISVMIVDLSCPEKERR